jgi:hypothetical protein
MTSQNSVFLLGIDKDNQLTFSKYIETLRSLDYLYSKRKFLNIEARKVLIESFIMSNFNYCPLVWMFCNANLKRKQENIQKRALRFLFDDYESTYKQLLEKANKPTIEIRKLRILTTDIFKTINNLNQPYMKEIFTLKTIRNPNSRKLLVKTISTKKYGTDSLRPRIWNCLPTNIRNSENIFVFKNLIKTWSGPSCSYTACN